MTDYFEEYKSLLYRIAARFGQLMDKQGEWNSDFTLWDTEYEVWNVDDMLYIIRNYGHLPIHPVAYNLKQLRNDVQEWLQYNVDVHEYGISYINLKSWLSGAPRMSKEAIEHLRYLKHSLERECEEAQSVFGKLDTSPQPKYLRSLKPKNT